LHALPKTEYIFNKNNANCKVYFNGVLVEDRLAHTKAIEKAKEYTQIKSRVMKSNLSKLHINPSSSKIVGADNNKAGFINNDIAKIYTQPADTNNKIKISPLQMADLTYFNYALTVKEIKVLYDKGFNKNIVTFASNVSSSIMMQKGKYIYEDELTEKTVKGI
jgi:hypothetical protein